MGKYVKPIMGEEEAKANVTVLRAVLDNRLLVEHDELLIRHVVEAFETAQATDGAPDANQLGPFQRQSETSRKAALANYPRSGSQRARILAELLRSSAATRDDLMVRTGLGHSSVGPRVKELIEGGWACELEKDGVPVERRTSRGAMAAVIVPTAKAIQSAAAVEAAVS